MSYLLWRGLPTTMSGYGPQQGELELLTAKNNVLRHYNHVGNGGGPYAVPKEGEREKP